jgi:hypothetical protein
MAGLLDFLSGGGGSPGLLSDVIDPATGKIDPEAYQRARSRDAMLGATIGLLSSSGPSRVPISAGQVIAQGLQGYLGGRQQFDQSALRGALANSQLTTAGLQQDVLRDQATGRKLLQSSLGGVNPSRATLPLASAGGGAAAAPVGILNGGGVGGSLGAGMPTYGGAPGAGGLGILSARPSVGDYNVGGGALPAAGGASAAPSQPFGLLSGLALGQSAGQSSSAAAFPEHAAASVSEPGVRLQDSGTAAGRLVDPVAAFGMARTMQAYGLPGGDAYLKFAEAPTGFYRTAGGGLSYERGGPDDPAFVGQKSFAQGYGQSQGALPADLTKINANMRADIAKAGPIAGAQARAQYPYELGKVDFTQQGAARFEPVEIRNPDGSTSIVSRLSAFGPSGYGGSGAAAGGGSGGSGGVGGIPGPLRLSPEQEADSKGLGEQSDAITKAGFGAGKVLERVAAMENARGQLGSAFRPGATGEARLAAGRALSDTLQGLGIKPPDWLRSGLTGAETIGKEGGYLTAEMTRSLGSREAFAVFQQIQNIQPNLKLTEGGFDAILNSIKVGAVRDRDMMEFRDRWLQSHNSIRGMTQAFDQEHPLEAYASRVIPYPAPSSPDRLKPNVIYRSPSGVVGLWNGQAFVPAGGQ